MLQKDIKLSYLSGISVATNGLLTKSLYFASNACPIDCITSDLLSFSHSMTKQAGR